MDHTAMKEQIFALYDGELAETARPAAEAHLAECLECREALEGWKRTAQHFFKKPKTEPSEFFVHQVMERIHDLEAPKQTIVRRLDLRWLAAPVIGIAAALLMAVLPASPALSTEALLIGGSSQTSSQWAFSKESMKTDEVLGFVLEGS